MYNFGGFGIDVKLYDTRNTYDIVWVGGNSYVRVAIPVDADEHAVQYYAHRNNFGEQYFIYSVNGIGEIRWSVNNSYDLKRSENQQVADYFKTCTSKAVTR